MYRIMVSHYFFGKIKSLLTIVELILPTFIDMTKMTTRVMCFDM